MPLISHSSIIIFVFTFLIHFTESSVYTLRLAGVRTKRIATALSLITSALLISRLSNMVQAPFVGLLVDQSVIEGPESISVLILIFRSFIVSACLGSIVGALCSATTVKLLEKFILKFEKSGSFIKTVLACLNPRSILKIKHYAHRPKLSALKTLSLKTIPKGFLIINVFVTAIYTIGVLCALLAGAMLPEFRATAIQLSGIVNGIATILLATFVDPIGAQITDQTQAGIRSENELKSVVTFLLLGRIVGTLVIAQVLLLPFSHYIAFITQIIQTYF